MQKPARALGEVLKNLFAVKATSNYPFEKAVVADRYRGRIAFDSATCIGCKMCMRVCPSKAIEILLSAEQPAAPAPAVEGAAAAPVKKKFDCVMSLDRCIYCAQCADSCPKRSLSSTQDFELANTDRRALKLHYK
jgi:formate hydrogenlyase subunit 6/NADH:ubiquinone oxidoreductase subunit I